MAGFVEKAVVGAATGGAGIAVMEAADTMKKKEPEKKKTTEAPNDDKPKSSKLKNAFVNTFLFGKSATNITKQFFSSIILVGLLLHVMYGFGFDVANRTMFFFIELVLIALTSLEFGLPFAIAIGALSYFHNILTGNMTGFLMFSRWYWPWWTIAAIIKKGYLVPLAIFYLILTLAFVPTIGLDIGKVGEETLQQPEIEQGEKILGPSDCVLALISGKFSSYAECMEAQEKRKKEKERSTGTVTKNLENFLLEIKPPEFLPEYISDPLNTPIGFVLTAKSKAQTINLQSSCKFVPEKSGRETVQGEVSEAWREFLIKENEPQLGVNVGCKPVAQLEDGAWNVVYTVSAKNVTTTSFLPRLFISPEETLSKRERLKNDYIGIRYPPVSEYGALAPAVDLAYLNFLIGSPNTDPLIYSKNKDATEYEISLESYTVNNKAGKIKSISSIEIELVPGVEMKQGECPRFTEKDGMLVIDSLSGNFEKVSKGKSTAYTGVCKLIVKDPQLVRPLAGFEYNEFIGRVTYSYDIEKKVRIKIDKPQIVS